LGVSEPTWFVNEDPISIGSFDFNFLPVLQKVKTGRKVNHCKR
jgi:hypothetical protein